MFRPFTKAEELEIRTEIRQALRRQNSPSEMEIARKERQREHFKQFYSDPKMRKRKRDNNNDAKRVKNGSDIPLGSEPTKKTVKISPFEKHCREILLSIFPHVKHYHNYKPSFLRNPITAGDQEGDIYLPELGLIIEVQDKDSHRYRYQVKRDIHKEEMIKFHGYDLIAIPYDVLFVDVFVREQWDKIVRKRLH